MTNFDHEVRDRANVARSARCKKASVKGPRGCTLPSDYLTAAQKRKLNGPVESFRLDKPLSLEAFHQLPDDLKKEYLLGLQKKFLAHDMMIADLFGVTRGAVFLWRKQLGISALGRGNGAKPGGEHRAAWDKWLCGEVETDKEETETTVVAEESEEITTAPVDDEELLDEITTEPVNPAEEYAFLEEADIPEESPAVLNQLVLELTGKFGGGKLASLLSSLPVGDDKVTIRIEVTRHE